MTKRIRTEKDRAGSVFLLLLGLCCLIPASLLGQDVGPEERFIALSEFQVWADWRGPEVAQKLSAIFNQTGKSHSMRLDSTNYVWDLEKQKKWVDEAAYLGAFNVYCIGDDHHTNAPGMIPGGENQASWGLQGHLFNEGGLNPYFRDFYFALVDYAHWKGFLVAAEPRGLPQVRSRDNLERWARTFLDPALGKNKVTDIIKLSLEWFNAYGHNPNIAEEVENFIEAVQSVNKDVLVYIDSIGGVWQKPRDFHLWLMGRFPKVIISHYLNVDQVAEFRAAGARNMMVQINPQEFKPEGGQFFVFHDRTVDALKKVIAHKVRFLSIAGVNYGYNRYNYELFLEVVRPHLKLAKSLSELKAALQENEPVRNVGKDDVRKAEEQARQALARAKH